MMQSPTCGENVPPAPEQQPRMICIASLEDTVRWDGTSLDELEVEPPHATAKPREAIIVICRILCSYVSDVFRDATTHQSTVASAPSDVPSR